MEKAVALHVNGKTVTVQADPATPLLYILRNHLQLNGPKFGCGLQQCGACMVLIDGKAQPSCMLPLSSATQFKITTLEGLGTKDKLHPVQQAFINEQAAQCGYCLNGMVISAVSLLHDFPSPDESTIREGLQRALCRCGSHSRILKAVRKAAQNL